ncbi:helix-turn-helix domain-containing protein [Kribbella sp. DT2]|uniref:helix-turn-helix domain-containing protein n=1 Tax=Kribbella sp. DT2 TaxID=3393427 RepID=UPI003CEC6261
MAVIEKWTGRHAHALREALRLTNESFAGRIGVAPRTITKWKERPGMVPSPHLQEALDAELARAPVDALTRFTANLGEPDQRVALDQASIGQLNAAVTDLARLLSRIELSASQQPSAH